MLQRSLAVLGRESVYYGDHFPYWGGNLCTIRRSFLVLGRESVYYGDHFLYWGRTCVLWRSLSVLGRESVHYGDHFLHWGDNLRTMEVTFCTGDGICVITQ